MKKIGWFRRLFMSWSAIERRILENNEGNLQSLKTSIAVLENDNNSLKKQVEDFKVWREEKDKILDEKNATIKKLEDRLLVTETNLKNANNEKEGLKNKHGLSENEIANLKERLMNVNNQHNLLKTEISEKLEPLSKIQKTFFASSGNKGKGELGELQLKTWLEKSGMDPNMWVENFSVDNMTVEFAIKADLNDKWIPVDSKVLDPDFDEDNKIIINDDYRKRVETQAKEIKKYLGKTHTTDYGILVLQNDNIYIELFDNKPNFFEEIIHKYKIFICSPSTFIQFAWTMSNILDIYKKVHKDEKLFNEVVDVLTTINKLSNSLLTTHKNFNTAMNTHYSTLAKRQDHLIKKMNMEGKVKTLPLTLDSNISNDEDEKLIDE